MEQCRREAAHYGRRDERRGPVREVRVALVEEVLRGGEAKSSSRTEDYAILDVRHEPSVPEDAEPFRQFLRQRRNDYRKDQGGEARVSAKYLVDPLDVHVEQGHGRPFQAPGAADGTGRAI